MSLTDQLEEARAPRPRRLTAGARATSHPPPSRPHPHPHAHDSSRVSHVQMRNSPQRELARPLPLRHVLESGWWHAVDAEETAQPVSVQPSSPPEVKVETAVFRSCRATSCQASPPPSAPPRDPCIVRNAQASHAHHRAVSVQPSLVVFVRHRFMRAPRISRRGHFFHEKLKPPPPALAHQFGAAPDSCTAVLIQKSSLHRPPKRAVVAQGGATFFRRYL